MPQHTRRTALTPPALGTALVLALLLAPVPVARAQSPDCDGRAACARVPSFVAAVTDFRQSTTARARLVAFTVRFHNTTDRPLRLGYVSGSGLVLDDQGNRYVVRNAANVRAIGEITPRSFDPKFVIGPGESSDARFEMEWRPAHGELFGTAFEGEVTVREIDPAAAGQWRVGREHVLRFRGLGGTVTAGATPAPADPSASPATAVAQVAQVAADSCTGRARCYDAGAFTAEVTSLVPSRASRHHVVRVELELRNRSTEPLALGYKSGTSSIVDEEGNRYYWGRVNTYDRSAQGIGVVTSRQADAQLVLRPGEARRVSFSLTRYDAGTRPFATSFSYDVVLTQLELLAAGQVRALRDYSLTFPALAAGSSRASAASADDAAELLRQGKSILDRLRGKRDP